MKKYILPLFVLLQYTVFGQGYSAKSVKDSIDKYNDARPIENVYLQYDRPAYNAGETIWFKAYIVTAAGATNLSKNFYVDFADTAGNVLMHGVYPVQASAAAGNFKIPASYNSKTIHVHAYTRWMLNFDSAFLYDKDIRIFQVVKPGTKPAIVTAPTASVQFFPEGGDYVAGIRSKVAFKAVYSNGLPANITGVITNSKGEVVDSIKSVHDGMGFFYLEPEDGETYTAVWQYNQGNTTKTPLPAVKAAGAVLQLALLKNRVGMSIARNNASPAQYRQMHIIATMQQQVVYAAPVSLDVVNFSGGGIPLNHLGTGILQVTLLDSNWQAVAERIMFINKNDYSFQPVVRFDTIGTGRREKNVLVIAVPDSLESNLSVAVTDADAGVDSTGDIVSKLLLTGQLKGNVYQPSYYFNTGGDSVMQQLDLVMLTNGWRRYKFNEIITGTTPPLKYQPDTSYLTLSGKIYGPKPGKIKEAGTLMVILKSTNPADTTKDVLILHINDDGSFTQPGYSFNDTLRAYYQFASKKGGGLNNYGKATFSSGALDAARRIDYNKNSPVYIGIDTAGSYYFAMLAAREAANAALIKQSTLKNIVVTAKAKTRLDSLDSKYTSGLFSGGNVSKQFDLINDFAAASAINALTYIQGKVAGLTIRNAIMPNPSVTWRNANTDFYLDEVPVTTDIITTISLQDIAYIKVFSPPFFGGPGNGAGGAIAIYTRRGGEVSPWQSAMVNRTATVIGYTATKEFYSPDYGADSAMNMATDVRPTLYWNPWVLTAAGGNTVRLPFYNNDITKKMRVVIEGIDGNGRFTRIERLVE